MALGLIQSGFIQQSVICADALNPIMSAREEKRVFMLIFLVSVLLVQYLCQFTKSRAYGFNTIICSEFLSIFVTMLNALKFTIAPLSLAFFAYLSFTQRGVLTYSAFLYAYAMIPLIEFFLKNGAQPFGI